LANCCRIPLLAEVTIGNPVFKCIRSTNLVLLDLLPYSTFVPCKRIRKLVRQLMDIVKRRSARPCPSKSFRRVVRLVYQTIKLWQESSLSHSKFCSLEKLLVKTFKYWYSKYKKGKGFSVEHNKEMTLPRN